MVLCLHHLNSRTFPSLSMKPPTHFQSTTLHPPPPPLTHLSKGLRFGSQHPPLRHCLPEPPPALPGSRFHVAFLEQGNYIQGWCAKDRHPGRPWLSLLHPPPPQLNVSFKIPTSFPIKGSDNVFWPLQTLTLSMDTYACAHTYKRTHFYDFIVFLFILNCHIDTEGEPLEEN